MSEIRGIVVPVDGSSLAARVVPVARGLAERTGAEITLVTSIREEGGATSDDLDAVEADLDGVVVHRAVVADRGAVRAAIDLTKAGDHRILCMSTHGRGGFGRTVLGSVAAEVVRRGEVPVLLVGPACDPADALGRPGPITVCVDGSERSDTVVAAGAAWSDHLDRDLAMRVVVHPLESDARDAAEALFERLRPTLEATGRKVTAGAIVRASVPEALVDDATTQKSPLMVVGRADLSRLKRLVSGDVILTMLQHAPCPVLVCP